MPALAIIEVISEDGDEVGGRTFPEDDTWVWKATEALEPDTEYDVVARAFIDCEPEVVSTFTTGPWGEVDAADIVGSVQSVEPDGQETFAEYVVASFHVAVWVQGAADGEVELGLLPMEYGDEVAQEECLPTTAFVGALEGPVLVTEPITAPFGDFTAPLWLVEAQISGLLRADGSGMDSVSIVGQIDIGEFMDCELAGAVGADCVPCSDGASETCVDVDLTDAKAAPVDWTPRARTEGQIADDDACL